jgi:DNA processing protein
MTTKDRVYWLWLLSLEDLGNRTCQLLLRHFENPRRVYEAREQELTAVEGLKPEKRRLLLSNRELKLAAKAESYMDSHDVALIPFDDERYPPRLRNIYNPPVALFARGDLTLLKRPLCIGMVGSRKASPGGIAQAGHFSEFLAQKGVTIISGFAAGIDTASHRGALGTIGSTVAVLGSGLNICYPDSNQALFREMIEKGGLLLTEFFFDSAPLAFHFPMRNRIISGLCDGLLVVEAAQKSGALITANHALEQGKNVYAIPRDISQNQSIGVNNLLKDGAKVVTDPWDILEDYVERPEVPRDQSDKADGKDSGFSDDETRVLSYIRNGYDTIDRLVMVSGMAIGDINALLTMLELKEIISVDFGKATLLI